MYALRTYFFVCILHCHLLMNANNLNTWLWPGLFKPTRDFSSDLTATLSSWALPTMHLTICFTCTAIVRMVSGMLCSTRSNEGFFLARTCSSATCSYRYSSTLGIILGIIMCLMERDILMEASIWWSFSFFPLNAQEIAGVFLQLVTRRQETPVARIKHFA